MSEFKNLQENLDNAQSYLFEGDLNNAGKIYKQILEMFPEQQDALYNLGLIMQTQGNLEESAACFKKVTVLNPDSYKAHLSLSNVLIALGKGKIDEAVSSLNKVIMLNPDIAEAHYNLGVFYQEKLSFTEAENCFKKAIALKPDWAEAYNNLGNVLIKLENFQEALECYNKALKYKPGWADIYNNIGALLVDRGNLEEATIYYEKVINEKQGYFAQKNIIYYLMQYKSNISQENWKKELAILTDFYAKFPRIKNYNVLLNPKKKLKIGYVSPDFYNHSCSWFILPLLIAHNRNKVEITCFSLTKTEDKVTEKIKRQSDKWFDISNFSNQEAVELILNNKIDILVDLAGHTLNNGLTIFAHKPAPIQVTWLGFPGSTGLDTIDYRLSDHFLTPENTSEYFTEKIWNLGRLSHIYKPPEDVPDIGPLPFLKNGFITFGSFNAAMKISDETIGLWAESMKKLPDSRIKLKVKYGNDEELRKRLLTAFNKNGIESVRIDIFSSQPTTRGHLEYYNQVDIALDSFPYNGATTTLEALLMGVPVVSLAGERTASRYGFSFLSSLNLPELAVNKKEDYIQAVSKLANNIDYLADLRATLRQRMAKSQLFDWKGFAREIEAAYREMWNQWYSSQSG